MDQLKIDDANKELLFHSEDISVKSTLDAVPGFKAFMNNVVCPLREKGIAIEYYGNGLNVTEETLPHLYNEYVKACNTLGVEDKPDLSMLWHYAISCATEGSKHPHITLLSGVVDLLDNKELSFLFGHELGHVLLGHKPYHMFLECLYMPLMNTVPGGKTWIQLVRTRMLQWYRISDFSADRVALLCCQDINVALRTLMKMSGLPKKYYDKINVDAFIKQAEEFDNMSTSLADKAVLYLSLNAESHPWLVVRAAELYKWYKSGEYQKALDAAKV